MAVTGSILLLLGEEGIAASRMRRNLSAQAEAMIESLPVAFRGAPEYRSLAACGAAEFARLQAAVAEISRQWWPQTATVGLPWWERAGGSTPRPDATLEERQRQALNNTVGNGDGASEWARSITAMVGPGWSFREHDPGDEDGPGPFEVEIFIPYESGSQQFLAAAAFIRSITDANLIPSIQSSSGFLLDSSQLDQQQFGF